MFLLKLKELLLGRCEFLMELPQEIGALVNLKVLDISGCRNLAGIPESIYSLQNLSSVDLRDCKIIKTLPKSIRKIRSLQNLYLSGCSSLVEFHRPEFSINRVSSTSQADKMEVLLDFHKSEGTLFDIRELLGIMENVSYYEFLISKSVAVRSLKVIHIRNSELPVIPDNLSFPDLEKLFLESNRTLTNIPSRFFKGMPALKVLDLSNTRIKTLLPFVSELIKLEQLILRHCQLLMELPPQISALENLKVLDLEGTDLAYLPDQLETLSNLKCLKVSLYDCESYRKTEERASVIPGEKLSKLTQLEDLSITIDPHSLWCTAAVETILKDLPSLDKLKTLKLYLPTAELLKSLVELKWNKDDLSIFQNLSNFNVNIGPYAQRFISRVPSDLEEEFLKLKKCLKYVNGDKECTSEFAVALKHANSLYLDRHWTLQKLSVFKSGELNELKFCLLVDCNEMETVFDESDYSDEVANKGDNLHSLEYLAIHYLEKLEVICKGPGAACCLRSLKVLVLHTCPSLITIFTPVLVEDLVNLEEIIVEDCPKIQTLVTADKNQSISKEILPKLKKLSLLYLPELVSISGDFSIGPELKTIVIYDCPMLKRLPSVELLGKAVIEVKGESEWWKALEWNESERSSGQPYYLPVSFDELDTTADLLEELALKYGKSLRLFVEDCKAN
ncbi:disease resistance protein At4g27190-like [Apium graveolens]|uniref:disease resistance protein At4g27190-like n=1 Tax=Apium graveolens TaxID=4045 RepID=UPI003D7A2365